jgi:hypothetical protein
MMEKEVAEKVRYLDSIQGWVLHTTRPISESSGKRHSGDPWDWNIRFQDYLSLRTGHTAEVERAGHMLGAH